VPDRSRRAAMAAAQKLGMIRVRIRDASLARALGA
jgi:hypothetical protein